MFTAAGCGTDSSSDPSPSDAGVTPDVNPSMVADAGDVSQDAGPNDSGTSLPDACSVGTASPTALKMPFVFGTLDQYGNYPPTAEDEALSQQMLAAWAQFAKTDTPQTTPDWPAYGLQGDRIMVFNQGLSLTSDFRNRRCDQLRTFGIVR